MKKYVIGIDFGTDSCRAIIVDGIDGTELASATKLYPRWAKGLYCEPEKNQYRQHPLDHIESMSSTIKEALSLCASDIHSQIVGIGIDTTGSTPVLIDKDGTPLSLLSSYRDNPNAMFVLWKDHTAIEEAEEINKLARQWETDYTGYSGGIYSSEWVWAKMLHMLRTDIEIRKDAFSWVEHCDWIPAILTGNIRPHKIKRSRCAAGHKAMWNEKWGGLPPNTFWKELDPLMNIFTDHLFSKTYTCDQIAGTLTPTWAETLGLSTNVIVAVGGLDSHLGAVGAQISEGTFVKVLGTSTCDMMVSSTERIGERLIPGICGQVNGSVIPGMIGLEAGQSAFGDIYAWFRKVLEWPLFSLLAKSELIDSQLKDKLINEISQNIIPELTLQSEKATLDENQIIATDWMNGRRTPYANQRVLGTISNLALGSTAPMIFKSLVEATAYGSKAIVEYCIASNIEIKEVIAIGGISQKSPFVMQILSDILNLPIKVAKTEEACALGAAMFASVASGLQPSITEAQKSLGQGFSKEYMPDNVRANIYDRQYDKYKKLCRETSAEHQ